MLASFAFVVAALLAVVMSGFAQVAQTSSFNNSCIALKDLGVEGAQSVKLAYLILEGAKEVQRRSRASVSVLARYFFFRRDRLCFLRLRTRPASTKVRHILTRSK